MHLNPKPVPEKAPILLNSKKISAPDFAEATVPVQKAGVTVLFFMAVQWHLLMWLHALDLAKGNSKQGKSECTI